MAIFSTGTSGIFSIFHENLNKIETALILKCIDQLYENLVRVYSSIHSFDTNLKFFCSSYFFHCILLFVYCLFFVLTLMLF